MIYEDGFIASLTPQVLLIPNHVFTLSRMVIIKCKLTVLFCLKFFTGYLLFSEYLIILALYLEDSRILFYMFIIPYPH